MFLRTHIAITVFAVVLFFHLVSNPVTFVLVALFATMIPDIDTPFSKLGKFAPSKVVQAFTNHRGVLHSLTACILLSLFFAAFLPLVAFGFFLGYSMHLLADSFNKAGIIPFWPYPKKAEGFIITGGIIEKAIFACFVLVDLILVAVRFV